MIFNNITPLPQKLLVTYKKPFKFLYFLTSELMKRELIIFSQLKNFCSLVLKP